MSINTAFLSVDSITFLYLWCGNHAIPMEQKRYGTHKETHFEPL